MMADRKLPAVALPLVWCALVLCSARIGRTMNQHGRRVMNHWRRFRPAAYADLENPEAFFTAAGEELETEISMLAAQIAGPDLAGEEYLDKVARLRNAQAAATETAFHQSSLMETETTREEWESDTQETLLNLQNWAWAMQAQQEGLEQTQLTYEETAAQYRLPIPFLQDLVASTSPYQFLSQPASQLAWQEAQEARWRAFHEQ